MSLEMFSLDPKVAIVTGASRGIGRGIALGFAGAGAAVTVAARNEEDLNTLVKEIEEAGGRALAVVVDVTQRADLERMVEATVETFGRLDILVNNAGGSRFMAPLLALRPEGWDKMIALNLDSVFHATQLGAQAMVMSGGGSIIQISSVAGIMGVPTLSFYSAAKAGVRLMSQAVAKELAGLNVRVNSIAPGWIDTDLNDWIRNDPQNMKMVESTVPMGRMGTVDEIVGAAIYLASDASSYVTGTTIVIDGGQLA